MEKGDEEGAEEWLDPNHRDGAGQVSDHEREAIAHSVKSLFEETQRLEHELEHKFDLLTQSTLDVQRLEAKCRRWQERQDLEIAARVAASEGLRGRKTVIAGLKAALDEDKTPAATLKLKVVNALLELADSSSVDRLSKGEFVSVNLTSDDVEKALRAS